MRSSAKRKLDSVPPVLKFCREHPNPLSAAREAVGRLIVLHMHVSDLLATWSRATEQLEAEGVSTDRVTPRLRGDLVLLVRIADVAADQEKDERLRAGLRFGPLTRNLPLNAGLAALEAAFWNRAIYIRYGMPEEVLARLRRELDEHCAVLERRAELTATIAAATRDLTRLADEARLIIKHLDALNRIRFAEDPERLALWRRAQAVPWGKGPGESGRSDSASAAS